MWPLIVLLIPLCGYLYIESDTFLSYRLKKLDGWHAYFMAATQGILLTIDLFVSVVKFLFTIFFLTLCLFFCAGLLGGIVTLVSKWKDIEISSIFSTFITIIVDMVVVGSAEILKAGVEIIGENASSNNVAAIFGGLLVFYTIARSSKQFQKAQCLENKQFTKKKIASDNKIEAMFFEAENSGLLIMVTLKSRKVYVGQVIGEDSGYVNGNEIAIIPILSGYRNKDTLSFEVEHDYSRHYLEEQINGNSIPSLDQFRQILFFDQIESMSLFNSETYKKFQLLNQDDTEKEESKGYCSSINRGEQ